MSFKKFIENIDNSFKQNELGYSARKLSGFTMIFFVGVLLVAYILESNLPDLPWILVILLAFAGLCFTIYTLDDLSRFKSGITLTKDKKIVIETPDTTVTTIETGKPTE